MIKSITKKLGFLATTSLLILSVSSASFAQQNTHSGDATIDIPSTRELSPKEKVAFLLSSIHETPSQEQFLQIPNARTYIEALALSHDNLLQHRAVSALQHFPDAGTLQTYTHLLRDRKTKVGIQHEILLLLGKTFDQKIATPILIEYLNNADPQIRITSTIALAQLGSDDAISAIAQRHSVEKDPFVIKAIEREGRVLR